MILLDHREVDGLLELAGKLREIRPRHGDEIGARRGGEPQDGRSEPHPAVRRGGDQKFLRLERGDDALHRGARQIHALRDLAEAQARRFVFERAQDRRRARDHLHLALRLSPGWDFATPLSLKVRPADGLHCRPRPYPHSGAYSCCLVHRFDTGSPACGTADAAELKGTPGTTWSARSRSKSIS